LLSLLVSLGLLIAASGCHELWSQTLELNTRNCVASPSACSADEVCNPGTELCERGLSLDSVEPRRAHLAGGTLLTLRGRGFFPDSRVSFGALGSVTPASVLSDSEIRATVPPGRACGPVSIKVQRSWGLSVQRDDLLSLYAPNVSFGQSRIIGQNPSTWTVYVTTHDLNGDGNQDVIATAYNHSAVDIFLGNGDGTFQFPPRLPTGASPYHVAVGDFNQDRTPDLAVTNTSGSVTVFIGTGGASFRDGVTLPNPNAQTSQILDFNSDKLPDLAVLTRDGKLRLWSGDGTGALSFFSETAVNSGTTLSSAADLDGDGRIDLILGGRTSMSMVVYRNRGDGTFEELAANPLTSFPTATTLADLNGDGKLDAIAAEYAAGMTSVLLGRGDGTFEPRRPVATGGSSRIVSAADINCDGRLDVAVSHLGNPTVTLLLGRGDGTFEPSMISVAAPGAIAATAAVLADLDHDGRADLLIGTDGLSPSVQMVLNTSQ
jgi:hypothetical protein